MIAVSGNAQALLLASKHLGTDPYELHHLALSDRGLLPAHPRPMVYRAFLEAGADWLEEQEKARMKGVFFELAGAVLGAGNDDESASKKNASKRRKRPARHRKGKR